MNTHSANSGLYYLCIPYQGSAEYKARSHSLSLRVTTACLKKGIHVFAPVLYVNTISDAMEFSSLEARREVIMPYLETFLKVAEGVILVTLDGWQESWGVQHTLALAEAQKIPMYKVAPEDIEADVSIIRSVIPSS